MAKYQMIYDDGSGGQHYDYFDADENPEKIACEKADAYMVKSKSQQGLFRRYTPYKRIKVVEYDMEKKGTKRGGKKFVIRLTSARATFSSGVVQKAEWYEVI